jgi:hypothetical protein
MSVRHGFKSSSTRRRRIVSRDRPSCSVSLTIAPASRSSAQRRAGPGGRHPQCPFLAREFARRSQARFFVQREFQVAFHEASFGQVNRRAANQDAARDRLMKMPLGKAAKNRPNDIPVAKRLTSPSAEVAVTTGSSLDAYRGVKPSADSRSFTQQRIPMPNARSPNPGASGIILFTCLLL